MKPSNYIILEFSLASNMQEAVRAYINEGWHLHGSLISTGKVLLQAMVFYPEINRDLERR